MSSEAGPTLFDTPPPEPPRKLAAGPPDVPADSWSGFDWWWTYWHQQATQRRKAAL